MLFCLCLVSAPGSSKAEAGCNYTNNSNSIFQLLNAYSVTRHIALCELFHLILTKLCEVGVITIHILQMKELRQTEIQLIV